MNDHFSEYHSDNEILSRKKRKRYLCSLCQEVGYNIKRHCLSLKHKNKLLEEKLLPTSQEYLNHLETEGFQLLEKEEEKEEEEEEGLKYLKKKEDLEVETEEVKNDEEIYEGEEEDEEGEEKDEEEVLFGSETDSEPEEDWMNTPWLTFDDFVDRPPPKIINSSGDPNESPPSNSTEKIIQYVRQNRLKETQISNLLELLTDLKVMDWFVIQLKTKHY